MELDRAFRVQVQQAVKAFDNVDLKDDMIGNSCSDFLILSCDHKTFHSSYIPILADNSCFFNAIYQDYIIKNATSPLQQSVTHERTRHNALFLRRGVVRSIYKGQHKRIWSGDTIKESVLLEEKQSVRKYCHRMLNPNEWGGLIEVEVTSLLMQINIIVLQNDPITQRLEARMMAVFSREAPTTYLYLNGWARSSSSHFSLLSTQQILGVTRLPFPKPFVAPIPTSTSFLQTTLQPTSLAVPDCEILSMIDIAFVFGNCRQDLMFAINLMKKYEKLANISFHHSSINEHTSRPLMALAHRSPFYCKGQPREDEQNIEISYVLEQTITDQRFVLQSPGTHQMSGMNSLLLVLFDEDAVNWDLETTIQGFQDDYEGESFLLTTIWLTDPSIEIIWSDDNIYLYELSSHKLDFY